MAPAQSRQLLIWSIPTIVLLFGYFWYRRKKNFSQSDPGGKIYSDVKSGNNTTQDSDHSVKDLEFNFIKSSDSLKKEIKQFLTVDKSLKDIILLDETPVKETHSDELQKPNLEHTDSLILGYTDKEEIQDIQKAELSAIDPAKEDSIISLQTSSNLTLESSESELHCSLSPINSKLEPIEVIYLSGEDSSCETIELDNSETEVIEIKGEEYTKDKIIDCSCPMVKKKKQTGGDNPASTSSPKPTKVQECNKENNSFNSNNMAVKDTCTAVGLHTELDNILDSKITDKQDKNQCNGTLEKQLSNLGLNTAGRDSANHSPAEVMLGSPSMCHYSDEHSEGSSDSGKGCSDVVTPPSRTPAGGSSVAGEVLSVYEFVLEQHIVGRLIGRHGAYLQDIRAKTNTNLFIKRHPETTKLKICAIEGTQQDIDAALAMIRQKFPLRRFPNLTLEKVTFVQPPSPCPLKPDIFQLQLVDGVNNDVLLSSLISAGHFFLQQPTHPSYPSLHKLNVMMNALYSSPEAPPLSEPIVDAICVAPTMGGWYRAQIMSIDEQNSSSDVRFLDYGGYLTVDNSSLRQIRGDFLLLPFQAIECLLANVVPAGGEWSEEARQVVQWFTQQQVLQAQVYDYTDTGIPLVYLYATQATQNGLELVLINEELVARGYAEMVVA